MFKRSENVVQTWILTCGAAELEGGPLGEFVDCGVLFIPPKESIYKYDGWRTIWNFCVIFRIKRSFTNSSFFLEPLNLNLHVFSIFKEIKKHHFIHQSITTTFNLLFMRFSKPTHSTSHRLLSPILPRGERRRSVAGSIGAAWRLLKMRRWATWNRIWINISFLTHIAPL